MVLEKRRCCRRCWLALTVALGNHDCSLVGNSCCMLADSSIHGLPAGARHLFRVSRDSADHFNTNALVSWFPPGSYPGLHRIILVDSGVCSSLWASRLGVKGGPSIIGGFPHGDRIHSRARLGSTVVVLLTGLLPESLACGWLSPFHLFQANGHTLVISSGSCRF